MMPKAGLQNKEAKAALPDSEAQKLTIMDYLKLSQIAADGAVCWWRAHLARTRACDPTSAPRAEDFLIAFSCFMLWKELQLRPSSSDG